MLKLILPCGWLPWRKFNSRGNLNKISVVPWQRWVLSGVFWVYKPLYKGFWCTKALITKFVINCLDQNSTELSKPNESEFILILIYIFYFIVRQVALVYWLRQIAHDQEVVTSNSGTVYRMDVSNDASYNIKENWK